MNQNLIASLHKPPLYTRSTAEFWNDEYISKQMLNAHLNQDFDGASRKLKFIEASAAWIGKLVPATDYPDLLDLGCGPGIYTEKFAQLGYHVTGMDFSQRSIHYAMESAVHKQLTISYLYQNYLDMELEKSFDFCTMIYCDYGALSTEDRKIVLRNVYQHLKPGGKFLFDVFSMNKYDRFQEQQTWEICPSGGFWRGDEYAALNGLYKYPDNVTLKLISVISKDDIIPYYIWDTYFSRESLIQEVEDAGFEVAGVYGDVAGSSYLNTSDTIAILLQRND